MESIPPPPPPPPSSASVPPPPPNSPPTSPRRPGWWARNWKWFLPTGCFSLLALSFGFVALIVVVVFGAMKSSDVYKEALRRAQKNPEVIAALGEPIQDGMFLSGSTKAEGPSGEANLSVPIHGPKGKGTLYVEAQKSSGKWIYNTLAVEVGSSGKRIDLSPKSSTAKPKSSSDEDATDEATDDDDLWQ